MQDLSGEARAVDAAINKASFDYVMGQAVNSSKDLDPIQYIACTASKDLDIIQYIACTASNGFALLQCLL